VQSGLSSLGVVSIDDVPADMLYNECRTIIDKMETATQQLLSERLPHLQTIATALLEEESMDQRRFQSLLN
jgi:ATP-dependent Zn protease